MVNEERSRMGNKDEWMIVLIHRRCYSHNVSEPFIPLVTENLQEDERLSIRLNLQKDDVITVIHEGDIIQCKICRSKPVIGWNGNQQYHKLVGGKRIEVVP